MSTRLEELSLAQLAEVNNYFAKNFVELTKEVKRFPDKETAIARVQESLTASGQSVIFVKEKEYKKRGVAKDRFVLYRDGMVSGEFVDQCVAAGHPRNDAMRDLRYDSKRGLIELVGV